MKEEGDNVWIQFFFFFSPSFLGFYLPKMLSYSSSMSSTIWFW